MDVTSVSSLRQDGRYRTVRMLLEARLRSVEDSTPAA